MATLGITSEAFYDLSPVEFYYGLKSVSETRRAQSRELYEVARLKTIMLINHQPGRPVHKQYKEAKDLIRFSWEEEMKQTVNEMKSILLSFAAVQNIKAKKEEALTKK